MFDAECLHYRLHLLVLLNLGTIRAFDTTDAQKNVKCKKRNRPP